MKIALLSSHLNQATEATELGYETQQLQKALISNDCELILVDPSKLSYGIDKNLAFASFVSVEGKLVDIKDVDALLIRRTRGLIEQIIDFAEFADRANPNLVISDPLKSFGRPVSKVESILQRISKFPQPDTEVISEITLLREHQSFPVVAKPTHGAAGKDVSICNNRDELKTYLETIDRTSEYSGYGTLVQEALPIDREFRVMVVGGVALGCAEKSEIAGNSSVRNAAQGSVFKDYVGLNRKEIISFAESVSIYSEQDISGVDIIQSNGKLFIIECNRNPQFVEFDFATQSRTAQAIVEMLGDKVSKIAKSQIRDEADVTIDVSVFPRIFIGCSSEGLKIAEEVQYGLNRSTDPVLWNQGVFQSGESVMASLHEALRKYDYAIFCITPDDLTSFREETVFEPRDNVIFEAGLFMGRLGPDRVILVVNSDEWPSLPSDLNGVTLATWRMQQSNDLRPSLASAILDIKRKIGVM